MKSNNTKKLNSGFGLLEVVISCGILVTAIAVSITLNKLAVKNSVISLERVQAYNLAQEGIEQIRSVRDTNWIGTGLSWNDSFKNLELGSSYRYDAATGKIASGNDEVTEDGITFKRELFFEPIDNSSASSLTGMGINNPENSTIKIKTKISWTEYGISFTVEPETYLTDWRPRL